MSHVGTGYDINQTFIIEPLDNNIPLFSACTALYTNNILSCSGNTQIFLGNGVITFDGNLYTNDDLTANTINASTYYSGGTSLIDIIRLKNITGGTFNNTTDTLTLFKQDNSTVVVTGFTDYFTTGATLIGSTVYFDRNDALSAYTLDLSSFSADTYVTGVTFSNNQLIIGRNDGVNLNTFINTFTGLTINGVLNANSIIANNISATTISASTFYGDGSNLTGISTLDTRISGFSYTPNTFTIFDTTGGTYSASFNTVSGLTVNGSLTSNSISANTISATTFFGDGSNLTGISTQDTFVTGGTYSNGTAVFTNNTGGTFSVTGFSTSTGSSFTGGTVSGSTVFTNGLTADTISATTYQNLPLDIHVTGFTFNSGDYNITIYQNDGSSYTQSLSTLSSDLTITGGTYNPVTGVATFTNNTGGTFTVTGFLTGYTDTTISAFTYNNANTFRIDSTNGDSFSATINSVTGLTVNGSLSATTYLGLPTDIRTTGATYSNNTFTFTNNTGGTYNVLFNTVSGLSATTLFATTYQNLPTDIYVTGGTYTNGNAIFTNNTGGTFSVTGFPIGGGGGQLFYLNISQSKNGNRYLSTTASTSAEQSTGVTINSGVTGTIASFQSDQLGITLIPGGIWSFYLHSYKDTSNAIFDIFVEVYKLSSGGTSTLLFTTDPAEVTATSPTPSMILTDVYFSGSPVVVTDSIVAVVRATNTSNQSHTITLVSEGLQHYSYVVSTLPTQQGLTCDTLSGCSTIQTIQSNINNKLDKSGGTITNNLVINGGLTATTLSASTYLGLPTDIRVTGGTYSNGTAIFTNNTGGTFSVTGLTTPFTGGTVSGNTVFTNGLTATTISATTYLNTPYWTSGSTGSYSIKAKNDSSIDATGNYSLAEGYATTASGVGAHAEGGQSTASGIYAHGEGYLTTASGDYSHAEGQYSTAIGDISHAEGYYTTAIANGSHTEGSSTIANGIASHAEGYASVATGLYSHVEGQQSTSVGDKSHAEGYVTTAIGDSSHAEGISTIAQGNFSHAEGNTTTAIGIAAHAEGNYTIAQGDQSHAEGNKTTAIGPYSHAEGEKMSDTSNHFAYGNASHIEGGNNIAYGSYNHAEGTNNLAIGIGTHVEGYNNKAGSPIYPILTYVANQITLTNDYTTEFSVGDVIGLIDSTGEGLPSGVTRYLTLFTIANINYKVGPNETDIDFNPSLDPYSSSPLYVINLTKNQGAIISAHAEGQSTTASGWASHSEGFTTIASGITSHAEGYITIASGNYGSHSEGYYTTASGDYSHAEGSSTIASGSKSHAEGWYTVAIGDQSHAEGYGTTASGSGSHAEGQSTTAQGRRSHAEGESTTAEGDNSHAGGALTVASGGNSFVHGSSSQALGISTVVFGDNIIGTADNTVYVPYFNIQYLSGGTSVNNLGIDANGYVVAGTAGGGTFTGGTVSGPTRFTNGLTASTLTVTGSTILSGSTRLNNGFNTITYNNGYTATIPTGSYTVNGMTNLNGIISVTGNTSIYGNLSLTGNTRLNGSVSASTLTLTSVPVNDDTSTQILSRDATTGAVEYVNYSAITAYNYGLSFAIANAVYLT